MKISKLIITLTPALALAIILSACNHATPPEENTANAKPYPLDTRLVCGMKLSMADKPVTFVYQGQQIKVCDASEKADFDKDPAKYLKQLPGAGDPTNQAPK